MSVYLRLLIWSKRDAFSVFVKIGLAFDLFLVWFVKAQMLSLLWQCRSFKQIVTLTHYLISLCRQGFFKWCTLFWTELIVGALESKADSIRLLITDCSYDVGQIWAGGELCSTLAPTGFSQSPFWKQTCYPGIPTVGALLFPSNQTLLLCQRTMQTFLNIIQTSLFSQSP